METGNQLRVVDHIVRYLAREARVSHVFGVHGANIEDLYDALQRWPDGPRGVIAKHEFSAGTMADGYYRMANRPAVLATTSGGGALNTVAALGEAYTSGVPMFAMIGEPPTGLHGQGAFQDLSGANGALDGRALFGTVARFCERVSRPEDIAELLPAAVEAATGERPGPSVLLLPKDVQRETVELTLPARPVPVAAPSELPPEVTALLGSGGRTVLVAGLGVAIGAARAELAALADALDATVAVEADGKDAFDNHSPRFLGVMGVMGHPGVHEELTRADLCVLVGTRLAQGSRYGLEVALDAVPTVCFADQPPFSLGDGRGPLWVPGRLRATLPSAVAAASGRRGESRRVLPAPPWPTRAEPDVLSSQGIVEDVHAVLDGASNVVSDAGNASAGAVHFLGAARNGRQVLALGMGGMGFSFGAGVGGAFATGKRTYVLAGDGAFFMHGMEVHTAVEYDLPVTFVVFNNSAHAMCVTREQLFYPDVPTLNRFHHRADIAAGVAAMFPSLRTVAVTSRKALRDFLRATDRAEGPAFVSVDVPVDEMPPYRPLLDAFRRTIDRDKQEVA
nr:thiamine pyrophosphate-binding protein [Kibdelosporangium sp. MJ126-NF4]CEL14730.1 Acetolactate synthase large subunit [Kibdelosporangium sp. MJ126-NF4]CTQ96640.1 Acetolactate synthase large subunit (EC 2.2.1.6) [Kibdelosporangium sp. MJ126-NF4]